MYKMKTYTELKISTILAEALPPNLRQNTKYCPKIAYFPHTVLFHELLKNKLNIFGFGGRMSHQSRSTEIHGFC